MDLENQHNLQRTLFVVGAGAWGQALAGGVAGGFLRVILFCRDEEKMRDLVAGGGLADNIEVVCGLDKIADADAILLATPSFAFSKILKDIAPQLTKQHKIAWATKGFDTEKGCFLAQSFKQILPEHQPCAISGPSFAVEVAGQKPTALVVASADKNTRDYWAAAIQTSSIRAYTNDDVIGVEVGGAVKNILAIAAGIAAGLGFGANTEAALITRGLAEMMRFGVALGADTLTFGGLSGLGDLVLTCSNDLSRNRRFGKQLAANCDLETALKNVGGTVEGVNSLSLVLQMAAGKIEMPICEQVNLVVKGEVSPEQAVTNLLTRTQTDE